MTQDFIRECGVNELYCTYYHEIGASTLTSVTFNIEGQLPPDILRHACSKVAVRHKLLQSFITDKSDATLGLKYGVPQDDSLAEEGVTAFPFKVITREDDDHWKRQNEIETRTPIAEDAPVLWRVTYLVSEDSNKHDIIMTFNHSISDGSAFTCFADEVFAYCGALIKGVDFTIKPALPVPASIDRIATTFDTPPESTPETLEPWKIEGMAPLDDRITRYLFHKYDEAYMGRIKARSKQENVSMGALFAMALYLASAEHLGIEEAKKAKFGSAVNIRKFCNVDVADEVFAHYSGAFFTTHTFDRSVSIWELSKEYYNDLLAQLNNNKKNGFFPAKLDKRDIRDQVFGESARAEKEMVYTTCPCISNLGVRHFQGDYGPFQINEVYFNCGQLSGHFALWLFMLSVKGQQFMCLSYTEPLMKKETAHAIKETFLSLIEKAIS
jgi:hypothetical protein